MRGERFQTWVIRGLLGALFTIAIGAGSWALAGHVDDAKEIVKIQTSEAAQDQRIMDQEKVLVHLEDKLDRVLDLLQKVPRTVRNP